MEKVKYCYSTDQDRYYICDSREEAIKEAAQECESGDEYFIAVAHEITYKDVLGFVGISNIHENLTDAAMQEVGEAGEDWPEVTETELNEHIAKFLWEKSKPTFFRAETEEQETFRKK